MKRESLSAKLESIAAVAGDDGTAVQRVWYFASGLPVTENAATTAVNSRLHIGKEFTGFDGLWWYDNEARQYDPLTMRFTTLDPLAANYPSLSPYAYCANNPVNYIDPDGRILRDTSGNIVYVTDGKQASYEVPNESSAIMEEGFVFTNEYTPVPVLNNINNNEGWETNCHGSTFLEGKYWLNNEHLQLILTEDGYTEKDLKKARIGDIIVYNSTSEGNDHSMTIIKSDGTLSGTYVNGQSGTDKEDKIRMADQAWEQPENSKVYEKKEHDKIVTDEEIKKLKDSVYEK